MPTDPIFQTVQKIISEKVGIEVKEIKADSDFSKELGFDSLDQIEVIMEIEEKYGIDIEDGTWEEMKTVADLVSKINTLKQKNALP